MNSPSKVWLDDETYSPFPITNGVDRYAEGVEIMIRALALDDGPVIVTDLTPGGDVWLLQHDELVPAPLHYVHALDEALDDPDAEVWAQNSRFDRTVERVAGLKIPLHRWRDTMVQAMAHGLPGKLEQMCQALKLPEDKAKDKAGKALIQLFCKPQAFKFRKKMEGEKPADYKAAKAAAAEAWQGRATRDTHPAEWRQFLIYAGRDIISMRAASKIMPMWNYRGAELALWQLDQRINDRGAMIDLELAECALNAVDAAQIVLREKTQEMTGYDPETGEGVESATQRDKLLEYLLAEYGVDLPDMKKDTLERRIADPDLPEGLKELLRVRLQASTTSTSKYRVLIRATSSDGRLRGLLQFCGASRTGRWAGRLFQPQNLPSRGLLPAPQIAEGIEALKGGYADLMFDNVMKLTSSTIRGCIIAPPGRKLVVADLSNIEGRVVAWLAGEQWKLKAFGEFDTVREMFGDWITGPEYYAACLEASAPVLELNDKEEPVRRGPDLYKLSYAKSFGVSPSDVSKDQRQIGKVQELMLAYQGGVGAYMTGAATYGIDLEDMAEKAHRAIPGNIMGQARIMLEWHQKHGRDPLRLTGLSERAWLVCEAFVLGWREAHPNIAQFWKDLDATVREAITNPGVTLQCGKVRIRRDGAWLRMVLPSGRALCYPNPALVPEKKKKGLDEQELEGDEAPATGRTQISYMGMNQYTRKWERIRAYGGLLCENLCQAIARDVMAANMHAIEEAGYEITLTVHDEIITEAPDHPDWNPEHLAALMARVPAWAEGLPLAAAGFESDRYRKD